MDSFLYQQCTGTHSGPCGQAVHAGACFSQQTDAADKLCKVRHKAKSKESADIGHVMSVHRIAGYTH